MKRQLINLLQSLITGALIAFPAWALHRFYLQPAPFTGFLTILAISAAIAWLSLSRPRNPDQTGPKTNTPKWLHAYTTAPIQKKEKLHLAIDWNEGQAGNFADLDIEKGLFIAWCCGIDAGKSIGEDHWTGSGGAFSKSQYHKFRDELISRGFLRRRGRHHAQGFELTGKGAALCREVARRSLSSNGRQRPAALGAGAPMRRESSLPLRARD